MHQHTNTKDLTPFLIKGWDRSPKSWASFSQLAAPHAFRGHMSIFICNPPLKKALPRAYTSIMGRLKRQCLDGRQDSFEF